MTKAGRLSRTTAAGLLLIAAAPSQAAPKNASPLFSKGAEVFRIVDNSGRTPKFTVLDDSPAERALALAVIGALNSNEKVQPKIPVGESIDLKIENLKLTPSADEPNRLIIGLKLSGHEVELPKTIDRASFLSGKPVQLEFPKDAKAISIFSVETKGDLKIRLDKKSQNVVIDDAYAKAEFSSPVIGDGTEAVRFKGRGLRQTE